MFPNTHKAVIFKPCKVRFDFMVKWKVNRNPHTDLSLTTQQCCHSDTDEKCAFIYDFDSLTISDISLYFTILLDLAHTLNHGTKRDF